MIGDPSVKLLLYPAINSRRVQFQGQMTSYMVIAVHGRSWVRHYSASIAVYEICRDDEAHMVEYVFSFFIKLGWTE